MPQRMPFTGAVSVTLEKRFENNFGANALEEFVLFLDLLYMSPEDWREVRMELERLLAERQLPDITRQIIQEVIDNRE